MFDWPLQLTSRCCSFQITTSKRHLDLIDGLQVSAGVPHCRRKAAMSPTLVARHWSTALAIAIALVVVRPADAHGMTTLQCPNGFYVSKFNSAHDGSERLYKFGCTRFSSQLLVRRTIVIPTIIDMVFRVLMKSAQRQKLHPQPMATCRRS